MGKNSHLQQSNPIRPKNKKDHPKYEMIFLFPSFMKSLQVSFL